MKRGVSPNPFGGECFNFGTENKLRIFPPNTFKFKPRDHIILDEVQECILDNFWYQYNNKREDKGYMLAILNSLAEYFHMLNGKIKTGESSEYIEKKPLYIIYQGVKPGIFLNYENIISQKMERENDGGIQWRKYSDINEALSYARNMLGINYFIEPAAKEYIQKYRKANDMKPNMPGINIHEAGSSKVPTYKDVAKKEILNEDIIEKKIKERLNSIIPQLRKNIKDEVLKEVDERFQVINQAYEENIKKDYDEYIKKDYDLKMNIQISDYDNNEDDNNDMLDENMMDIRGHGQPPEY